MEDDDKAHLSPVVNGEVGKEIRQRRQALGLEQTELAKEAGIGRTTLHNIETGVSRNPTKLGRVLRALEAAEAESGVDIVPSERPDLETITFEVEGAFGINVIRAKGPREDRETLRDDVIAILRSVQPPHHEPPEE